MNEKVALSGNPMLTISGKTASGNDIVNMWVILNQSAPGMQNAEESGQLAADKAFIRFKSFETLGRGIEQSPVYLFRIASSYSVELPWQSEGRQEVGARQPFELPAVYPLGRLVVLAYRTMPVTT